MSSAPVVGEPTSPDPDVAALVVDLTAHLDRQVASAQRLLASLLSQAASIRDRDVEAVLERVTEMRTETSLRARLEAERGNVLARAGQLLGVSADAVTLERVVALMSDHDAEATRARSAELRGLLTEIAEEHANNRALIRQELAFLDHIVRLLGQEPEQSYGPGGSGPDRVGAGSRSALTHVLDLQA